MIPIRASEITPEHIYLSRRKFMLGLGAAALLTACGRLAETPELPAEELDSPTMPDATTLPEGTASPEPLSAPRPTPTVKPDVKTAFDAVTGYVNYYEFSLDKEAAAVLADESLQVSPWTVTVGGLVNKPRVFDIEELLKFEQEERVYRMRCVEGWSMVIPWLGFPLSRLLEEVEPLSNAKYVRFQTLADPDQMPGLAEMTFPWPYIEGLRLDEAMHDLTLIATGLYGWSLRPSNGAPLRLVVPWKYGFKSLKSIVRIDLVEEQPTTFWMASGAGEYGFWANVNPEVPHRRWSQATERRIGETRRIPTLLFNGYAEEVADLYPDLTNRDWFF